ncbi:uncharacterized protein FOMMEDRAFT_141675 [Fomitiporia mediterranea MF3/22]|uniref:uncharacterized protein n=1 Tax=Fomitiporia mediterranea (strain MF3/22) TaxID=694068 RepID=UPI0004408F4D|nr:uncharacterized protein FOMMEDRAFT_141675 [Fomitiporia mediterranea MF3/22]EJD00905.1 hypothetical protein FOMMEDRAFT_141675 [Fomitiporia mediterranea MF3/22]
MASQSQYLAVLRAAYDYTPDSAEEIAIKEDQILFLIERTDDDWWKVKPRDADESDEGGLVPAAYVEPAPHKSVVKAIYDYDATAPGELSIKEDEVLLAFDADDGWLLVQSENEGGKAGFVPESYVEAADAEAIGEPEQEEEEEEVAAPAIIVPPSPPRPSAPYIDPAERVAASHAKAPNDSIQTWAVSEVDKKGKKKKGTLGIGNGAIFFASESDKTPVQKWPTSDVQSSYIEKSKHVHIDIAGETPVNLHFNAGSKDTAEAIVEKLDASKAASTPKPETPTEEVQEQAPAMRSSPKPKKNGVSVHFASTPPSIISPREPDLDSEPGEYISSRDDRHKEDDGHEWVTVLYDFNADGEDELSVQEGDRLIVLEKDGDEWWKVRDALGHEGVVPASYVELEEKSGPAVNGATNDYAEEEAAREAEREQEEQRERERQEAERKRVEAERRAKMAAEAAEADRKRKERERERERKMKEEEERRRRDEEEAEEAARKRAARQSRPASASGSRPRPSEDERTSPSRDARGRGSSDRARSQPAPDRVRTWHDRTGQFKVDAEFLGFSGGKLRLHKTNGVVIEVPAEKMSMEDLKFIDRQKGGKEKDKAQAPSRALSPGGSDDEPLAMRRASLYPDAQSRPTPPKKGKSVDWFEFFLNAGCDLDDCTRYASSFERDKIDESLLPDITPQTLRTIGLREGDIIRVSKAIAARTPGGTTSVLEEQMKRDEELARKLQEDEANGETTPKRQTTSPGLFAGPGGVLKNNTRRGRPQSSKSTLPPTVDLQSITTASAQITRHDSPSTARVLSPTSAVTGPPRASSAAPVVSGFDDDAWTNRPSSTQPAAAAATTTTTTARAPSAPPTQTQPPAASAPPPAPPPPAAPAAATSTGSSLARTTESDVFEQLARLSALKTQNTVQSPSGPASAPVSAVSPPVTSPPVMSPPPGFQSGMGMGPSPVPIGQLQPQLSAIPQQTSARGPFAPVPANQGLLHPLVPTTTGFNGFVPTRPHSNPPAFNTPSPQPPFLNTQPTGFPGAMGPQPTGISGALNAQPTSGFGGGLQPQPTGLPSSGPMMAQTTSYPGALGAGPFSGGRAFGPLQPNVTGFNPGFNQIASPPPPVPPIPPLPTNNAPNNTAPANVFAQMKAGTFANDNAPQSGNKYDALRPQPTGWNMQGTTTGFQNGYSGPFY